MLQPQGFDPLALENAKSPALYAVIALGIPEAGASGYR